MFGNRNQFPLIDSFLKRFKGGGYERDYMMARASRSRSFEVHDFMNSLAADVTNKWTVLATSTATTWAVLAEPGGWQRGVTGASVATGAVGMHGISKFFNGTKGAGFAGLIRLSAVTNVRFEMGFVDVQPAAATTAVNYASNTFNSVTTGAVYLYDDGVAASAAVSGLFTIGVSTAFQTVAVSSSFSSAATLFVALELFGTTAKLWVGDDTLPRATITSAFAATEAWLPYFHVKTAGGSKNVDVDTLWTWTVSGRN